MMEHIEEEIAALREAGVKALLCIGYDSISSKQAIALAERFDEVYAAIGVHPENLEGLTIDCLEEIKELAKHPKVVAIGEIGLDYHWYKDPEVRNAQKPWFIQQIHL
ncbi:MAG: TatD family hydrolase, partial [Bacilli bacterium]|nr:TatD family hydrolase [Bacilli bacterium]